MPIAIRRHHAVGVPAASACHPRSGSRARRGAGWITCVYRLAGSADQYVGRLAVGSEKRNKSAAAAPPTIAVECVALALEVFRNHERIARAIRDLSHSDRPAIKIGKAGGG